MKNLNLEAYGVEEINEVEMKEIDGGFIEFLYEYFTGRSLASDARALTIKCAEAHAQVASEGGKTVADFMGCK